MSESPPHNETVTSVGDAKQLGQVSRRGFIAAAGIGMVAVSGGIGEAHLLAGIPLLKACINGARPPGSHPALPTTPEQCARAARAVVRAGAGAIHVHVRGRDGDQSISAMDVADTVAAIRDAVPDTPVGCSTHFQIVGDADRRLSLVSEWFQLPDFASVNFHETGAVQLARLLMEMGVGVEAGLFHADAARTCLDSGLAPRCLRLMLEPGAGALDAVLGEVSAMETVLGAVDTEVPRLLHGSRASSWSLIDEAARRAYQTRAGLEDTFELPDGSTARDNAEIVSEAARRIRQIMQGR